MIYNGYIHRLDHKFDYHIQEKQDIRNLMKEKEEIDEQLYEFDKHHNGTI